MLLPTLLLAALPALAPPPSRGADWEDVELPSGFALDLGDGLVANRLGEGRPGLRFAGGRLEGVPLQRLEPTADGAPRARVERGAGEPLAAAVPSAGLELCYDLGPDGWGYLRVLAEGPERLVLERCAAPPELAVLARSPARLEARPGEDAVELDWPAEPGGGPWRVERRLLGAPRAGEPPGYAEAGVVDAPPFRDARAAPGRLYEYRVAPRDAAAPFGARARSAAGVMPPERGVVVDRGATVDLLTGRTDGERVDLTVDFVGNNGAHLGCGPGVRIRMLTELERARWELEPDRGDLYREQRLFVNGERELAVVTAEGIYARLRVESTPGGPTLLYRQIDLGGGRVFPPPPPPPAARWVDGVGVVLGELPVPPRDREVLLERSIEREEGYQSGVWREIARLEPDAVEHVDPTADRRGLVRYRLRTLYGRERHALPGPPTLVLLGDDGGPDAEALLARALEDLAAPQFERRLEAQGVLHALGARAWPALRELLSSENPEVVAAARDLLSRAKQRPPDSEGAGDPAPAGDLAPTLLRARADALGLGEPPLGLFSSFPDRRALTLLRAADGPGSELAERWRALLAESDPDPGVRLVAGAVGAWPRFFLPPGERVVPLAGAQVAEPGPGGFLAAARRDPRLALETLRARLDPARPWSAFARLALAHELAAAAGGPEEAAALERAALGESLLARHDAEPDDTVFLGAALALVEDPRAVARAAVNLADLRLERASGPAGGAEGAQRAVVRLSRADTGELYDELEALRLADAGDVDLVLPEGVYEPLDRQPMMSIGGRSLRLLGEGRVELRAGLSVTRGSDVVLEGLVLAPASGTAVNIDRAAALLRDCLVDAGGVAVQANDGTVELVRTEIVPRDPTGRVAGGIRLGRQTMLLARDSRAACVGGCVSGALMAVVERCVLDGGEGPALEGRIDGRLVVIDSYLRSDATALSSAYGGVLDGAILASPLGAAQNVHPGLALCPVHTVHSGPPGELGEARRAALCPLGR